MRTRQREITARRKRRKERLKQRARERKKAGTK